MVGEKGGGGVRKVRSLPLVFSKANLRPYISTPLHIQKTHTHTYTRNK